MTTTPVKDVSSLLNFVGNQGTAASGIKAGSTGSFGDVMSKASYNDKGSAAQSRVESSKSQSSGSVNRSDVRKAGLEAKSSQPADTETIAGTEQDQAVAEAGDQVIRETAEELGVSEEEVIDAMEELGFGANALLEAENLTKLVLTLSGEESSLTLLTDEALYGKVQNLLQGLDVIRQGLMDEFSMNTEELDGMLATAADRIPENAGEENLSELPVQKADAGEEQSPKITVTVEEGTQSVKLAADENGNTIHVEDVAAKEESENDSSEKKGNTESGSEEKGFTGSGSMLESLFKDQTQNVEAAFEQMTAESARDTQEIMDQILEYMKIQVKPEMDQLEMQLHPESLGTLRIQLTSKGGEVTAQFHVQNEAVKAAIENQLTVLKDTLREQGVKVEAVEVTVESHAFESNLWQGKGRDDSNSYQGSKKTPRRINLDALDETFEEEANEEELLAAEMMKANGGTVDYTA